MKKTASRSRRFGPRQLWQKIENSQKKGGGLAYSSPGKRVSYAQLFISAKVLREKISESSHEPGQRLVFLGEASEEFLAAMLAAWQLGMVFAPLGDGLPPEEEAAAIKRLSPRFIVRGRSVEATLSTGKVWPEDIALVLFSSGTSHAPKCIPLHAAAIDFAVSSARRSQRIVRASKVLCTLSFFHSGGIFIQTLPALFAGASLHRPGGSFLSSLGDSAYTHAILVPSQVDFLSRSGQWGKLKLGHFRALVTGSASVERSAPLLLERGANLLNVYGSTEVCSFNVISRLKKSPFAAGKAVRGMRVRLNKGEVELRGPATPRYTLGAKGQPKVRTKKWFAMGDTGEIRGGNLFISGRRGESIRVGSRFVYPGQLENVVMEFPGVEDCAVVPRSHFLLGEVPVAYVVSEESGTEFRRKLREYCYARLGRPAAPAKFIFRRAKLPRTPTGKVMKHALS